MIVDVVMKSGEVWHLSYVSGEYAPMVRKLSGLDAQWSDVTGLYDHFIGEDGTSVFLNVAEIEGFNFVDAD